MHYVEQLQARLRERPLVLDGGLATALESAGHDLSGSLWSAKLLFDDPLAITKVHESYVQAGAEIIATASYQVSRSGFIAAGKTAADADAALLRSVALAREVAATDVEVAVSLGPYGASLADGSEYRGDYQVGISTLKNFHRQRLEVLAAAEAQLLAFETVPSILEVEAINQLLSEEFGQFAAWISCSARNESELSDGTPIAEAAAAATAKNLVGFGVNCTKPEYIAELVSKISLSSHSAIAYPNAGRTWDADRRLWLDAGTPRFDSQVLAGWLQAGVRLLGGCCGLGAEHVADVRRVRDAQYPKLDFN